MLGKDLDDIKKDYEEGERSGGVEGGGGIGLFFMKFWKIYKNNIGSSPIS